MEVTFSLVAAAWLIYMAFTEPQRRRERQRRRAKKNITKFMETGKFTKE